MGRGIARFHHVILCFLHTTPSNTAIPIPINLKHRESFLLFEAVILLHVLLAIAWQLLHTRWKLGQDCSIKHCVS